MKVKNLIEKLKQFDPELTVCLGDWSESYLHPSEKQVHNINIIHDGLYVTDEDFKNTTVGNYLQIGEGRVTCFKK
ncbi:MAG: hypothetical protein ACXV8O_01380 [Methylobacter sp.]